jgi:hypothetical protein
VSWIRCAKLRSAADHINQHLSAGRFFEAAGARSVVRESGAREEPPLVLADLIVAL